MSSVDSEYSEDRDGNEEKNTEEKSDVEVDPEDLETPHVNSVIEFSINLLAQSAWQYMGLVPNPVTQEVKKDMSQAKTAIDCVEFLIEKIVGDLERENKRDLQNLVGNLKINFVKKCE